MSPQPAFLLFHPYVGDPLTAEVKAKLMGDLAVVLEELHPKFATPEVKNLLFDPVKNSVSFTLNIPVEHIDIESVDRRRTIYDSWEVQRGDDADDSGTQAGAEDPPPAAV